MISSHFLSLTLTGWVTKQTNHPSNSSFHTLGRRREALDAEAFALALNGTRLGNAHHAAVPKKAVKSRKKTFALGATLKGRPRTVQDFGPLCLHFTQLISTVHPQKWAIFNPPSVRTSFKYCPLAFFRRSKQAKKQTPTMEIWWP